MAGLIKNQILKHLSRYAKNLSSDKINLSTFKGEGELRNLELDQEVMTELLSLPSWMKLTQATCNHVLIRIPWTKLKSVPIHLSLDEVSIRVEACEELRASCENNSTSTPPSFGKYGFVNKVIDGITATVNSVEITFQNREFESKVQISRIRVESRAPDWSKADLSGTRVKDMAKGETLIFKEMEWQTLRLEARSTLERQLAPLRLLANQAKARIVIKKSLNDSQVLGCRLSLILDDLLWVLTDSQILAALHFMSSLSGLVKQATETTQRMKAARKLESLPEYYAQITQANAANPRPVQTNFDLYDVKETSYHFVCEKIDLHFCDDPGAGRSQHPDLKDGGALQLSLSQVMLDFYPYHLATGSRKYWQKYSNNTLAQWLQQALKAFKISLMDALSTESLHTPLTRTNPLAQGKPTLQLESNPVKDEMTARLAKLMSSCLIVKIQDLSLYRVTTSSKRTSPLPFVSTFIERPKDLPVIHTEFSWFYYPGEICFPLPSAKIYAYLHPIQIQLDVCTILWLNSFVANLNNVMSCVNPPEEPGYADVRLEMIMPKVIFENTCEYPGQKERPRSLNIQVSRLVVSNYRSTDTGTLHQLTQCIELLQRGDLIYGSSFPSAEDDVPLLEEKFVKHAEGQDKLRPTKKLNCSSFTGIAGDLTKDFLWTEPRDIWYIHLDPVWADFHVEEKRKRFPSEPDSASSKRKTPRRHGQGDDRNVNTIIYPFVDAIPISAWVYVNESEQRDGKMKQKNIHALLSTGETGKIQLTHYQFLFIMRMVEAIGEMSLYLTLDSKAILGEETLKNIVTFVGYVNGLELSLLFPSGSEDEKQDSPSMELDSANPESTGTECENHQDLVESKTLEFSKNHLLFQKPFVSTPCSSSPLTRSLGGGSNPNLGSNPGNGFPGMSWSVKHSLTNLAVSFNKAGGGIATPDSEIVSNWSNFSSDSSDNFVQLDVVGQSDATDAGSVSIMSPNRDRLEELDIDSEIEVAVDAVEVEENIFAEVRSTPSPGGISHENSISRVDQDVVISALTVQLQGIEIAQESHGLGSAIKLQCKSAAVTELAQITWKDFQEKFCGRKRSPDDTDGTALPGSPTQRRAIKLRLGQRIDGDGFLGAMKSEVVSSVIKEIITPALPRINLSDRPGTVSPIRNAIMQSTKANLDLQVDFSKEPGIRLHMSTCMGLTDLLEDEILPNPIPMKIDLVGLNLELIEDRPPANITSPGSIPVKVAIPFLLQVSRDGSGVFQLGPNPGSSGDTPAHHVPYPVAMQSQERHDPETDFLRKELEKVVGQLQQSHVRNSALEQEREENECLKGLILTLQDEVGKLQSEKSALLRRYQHNYH